MFRFRLAHARLCNCAGCGRELLGESQREHVELALEQGQKGLPPLVAGRIREGERNAPYCEDCLEVLSPAGKRVGNEARRAPGQAAKLGATNS
jgi:hypothetical protein